jgi:hypothetical protein
MAKFRADSALNLSTELVLLLRRGMRQ